MSLYVQNHTPKSTTSLLQNLHTQPLPKSLYHPPIPTNSSAIPSLELLHSPIQPMLHHIAHVHVALPHLRIRHGQHGLDILQCKAVSFHALEGLRATYERLDVLGIDLEDRGAILDDAVVVRNLFVASGPVGVGFHGEVGLGFAAAL